MYMFDRSGDDAVSYMYKGEEWAKAWKDVGDFTSLYGGSYSCIKELEHLGCQGINIGSGYHDHHTIMSRINLDEYFTNLEKFVKFYYKYIQKSFPYKKEPTPIYSRRSIYDSDGYDFDFYHGRGYGNYAEPYKPTRVEPTNCRIKAKATCFIKEQKHDEICYREHATVYMLRPFWEWKIVAKRLTQIRTLTSCLNNGQSLIMGDGIEYNSISIACNTCGGKMDYWDFGWLQLCPLCGTKQDVVYPK
jgi:hypothetical protein